MHRQTRASLYKFVAAVLLLFTFPAFLLTCGGNGGSGGSSSSGPSQTGSLSFKLVFAETGEKRLTQQVSQAEFPCEEREIVSIDAQVLDQNDQLLVESDPFECEAGQGSVTGVPAGNNRTLVVNAGDESGQVIFQGQQGDLTIQSGQTTDAGTITLVQVANRPPVLDPIGPQTVSEGQSLDLLITAGDVDGNLLSHSIGNQPTGSNFVDNGDGTADFTWTPGFDASGNYSVLFTVTDDGPPPQSDSETVTITVGDVNRPPVLDSIGAKFVNENERLDILITAADPDGDSLSFSISNAPTGSDFEDNGDGTASFAWTPDFDASGNYSVLFTVTDDGSPPQSDSETLTITVGDVNRPPVLDAIGSKTVNEGELLEFTVSGSDPDPGDQLIFSASNLPSGAAFDPNTQTFSWIPGFEDAGNYTVRFTVTDDGSPQESDFEDVTITVGNVNRPPVLDPIGQRSVNEGQLLQFVVTGSDPDPGDQLIFSASNLPSGAAFDPNTRTFSWIPGFEDAGNYTVRFTVTDDGSPQESDFEDVTITVGNVNRPPVLTLVGCTVDGETSDIPVSMFEEQILQCTLSATDPDASDALSFSFTGDLLGTPSISQVGRSATFTWEAPYLSASETPYEVTFIVDDNASPSSERDSEILEITVLFGGLG